jgi:hypothetical protein
MKRTFTLLFSPLIFVSDGFSAKSNKTLFRKEYIKAMMIKVTDWQFQHPKHSAKKDLTNGAFLLAGSEVIKL